LLSAAAYLTLCDKFGIIDKVDCQTPRGVNVPKGPRNQQSHLEAVERQRMALELRKSGMSIRGIAQSIGVSPASAHKYLKSALVDLANEQRASAAELRALEDERLDRLLMAWFPLAIGGENRAPDPAAADRVLRIMHRRAAMHGLDAPAKVQAEFSWQDEAKRLGLQPNDLLAAVSQAIAERLSSDEADDEPA
jgi:AcrR family transcriptional regulator